MRVALAVATFCLALLSGCAGDGSAPGSDGGRPSAHHTVDLGPTRHVSGATYLLDVPADWEAVDLAAYRAGTASPDQQLLAARLDLGSRKDLDELEVMAAPPDDPGSQFTEFLTLSRSVGDAAEQQRRLFAAATAIGSPVESRPTPVGEAQVATGPLPIGPVDAIVGFAMIDLGDEVVSVAYSSVDRARVWSVLGVALDSLDERA